MTAPTISELRDKLLAEKEAFDQEIRGLPLTQRQQKWAEFLAQKAAPLVEQMKAAKAARSTGPRNSRRRQLAHLYAEIPGIRP